MAVSVRRSPNACNLEDVFSPAQLARRALPERVVRLVAAACAVFDMLRNSKREYQPSYITYGRFPVIQMDIAS